MAHGLLRTPHGFFASLPMSDPAFLMVLGQLLVLVVFTNRYVFGAVLATFRRKTVDAVDDTFEPTVTIVVPMFNEGASIRDTVASLLEQDYPPDKLSICVVDDRSTDDSFEHARAAARGNPRVRVLRNPVNVGKRRSINHAVREATSEIVVSVDSDVVVERRAVRELVRRFTRPDIAAVGGRVEVSNRNDNWLTRTQAIKYFFGYEYLKNVERSYLTVMCLSGCLTAYRRDVLLDLEPILESRNVCGVPIKYGEDRFLTRQIVKAGWRTTLTLDARCWTKAPTTLGRYFSQQLRWRRSNLVDYLGGLHHVWRLHPVVVLHYLSLFALTLAYPLILFEALSRGALFDASLVHLGVLAVFGAVYWRHARRLPADERVHPTSFLGMAVLMPVTYLVLTPLALFTLDSGSWETRGHGAVVRGGATAATRPAPLAGELSPEVRHAS